MIEGKPTLRAEIIDPESFPNEEELRTLPRVADHINWRIYTIAFVGMPYPTITFSMRKTTNPLQSFVKDSRTMAPRFSSRTMSSGIS